MTLWKHIRIEVKKRIDLDGCPAYVVTAQDMMSEQKKSLIIDSPIIDSQDVVQLEQHLLKSGIQIANQGVQYFIVVEENRDDAKGNIAGKAN